ncbi:MAG: hypothetical protein WDZ35_02225 [Crocinitomicaceae bacterium]
MMNKKVDIKKLIKRGILLFLFLGCIGLFVANKFVKKYDYNNLGDFISNYWSNKELANQADPTVISISISEKDYDFLKKKRQEALDRGVQIQVGENYIACEVSVGDEKVAGEIRLKGHMTDHLEGDKWSFRVKTESPIMGMYRFSLQHPGTRNYAYEWVYHQLLANEDIIYLKYEFVHLKLGDRDLGIYAMEEHFGQHILHRNDRPKGAILRWNPGLYWESRIDEMQKIYLDQSYSAYSSSYAEPYDRGTVKDDPELIATYIEGARLLEAFRRDSLKTSEVFDVPRMARFHAIIDLVGGHHSLDWSDVKLFYNSSTKKIEPVGYESFSIRKTERIAGQKQPEFTEGIEEDYHTKLFADPIFYTAYIENLERIADETYFHDFTAKIQEPLNEKLAILATEWPYRRFGFEGYYENIDLIRHNLALPKPFHAFIESSTDSTLLLSFAPVSDYPIEITAVAFEDGQLSVSDFYLPPKPRRSYTKYYQLQLKHDNFKINNLKVKAKIPGSKNTFEVEVNEYPSFENEDFSVIEEEIQDIESLDDVKSTAEGLIYFNRDTLVIRKNVEVKKDKTLRLLAGQWVKFEGQGCITVKGKLEMFGGDDRKIRIVSSTENPCIRIENSELHAVHVVFQGGDNVIEAKETQLFFQSCTFAEIEKCFLTAASSSIGLANCQMGSVNTFSTIENCQMEINNLVAKKGQMFSHSKGSYLTVKNAEFEAYEQFVELDHISTLDIWGSQFYKTSRIAELNNASLFHAYGCLFSDVTTGFLLDHRTYLPGKSNYIVYKTDIKTVKILEEKVL